MTKTKWHIPYIMTAIILFTGLKVINLVGWQVWALKQFGFNKSQIKNIISQNG